MLQGYGGTAYSGSDYLRWPANNFLCADSPSSLITIITGRALVRFLVTSSHGRTSQNNNAAFESFHLRRARHRDIPCPWDVAYYSRMLPSTTVG